MSKSTFKKRFFHKLHSKSSNALRRLQRNSRCILILGWGPFLESPRTLTGPKRYILKSTENIHDDVDEEADSFTDQQLFSFAWQIAKGMVIILKNRFFNKLHWKFQTFWNSLLEWKTKQLNRPGNYRELRETSPRSARFQGWPCYFKWNLIQSNRCLYCILNY